MQLSSEENTIFKKNVCKIDLASTPFLGEPWVASLMQRWCRYMQLPSLNRRGSKKHLGDMDEKSNLVL